MASKIYNASQHMFTTGATQDTVLLKPGTGETLELEGSINIVNGPNGNDAELLINGNNIGGSITLEQLADVEINPPLAAGNYLKYDGTKWTNIIDIDVPDLSTNYISTTSIVGPDFSLGTNNNLGVTTISRLQCDNIRIGLTDCLLRANSAERVVSCYPGINLNLTDGFIDLNTTIESTTIGPDCLYTGNIIASTYGGTGYGNIYGFINTCTDAMYFNQQLDVDAQVRFAKINELDIVAYAPLQGNSIYLGEDAGALADPGDVTDVIAIGSNSCSSALISGSDIVCLGTETGQYTNGSNITIIGSSVGINPCSGNNIILIGNDENTNVPTLFTNNYFCLRGAGTSPTVTPIIESTGLDGIKATTMYGNLAGNFTNFGYNGYNITFTTSMKFNQPLATTNSPRFSQLGLLDLTNSYSSYILNNDTLSADRTLNLQLNNADRTLNLNGNLTVTSNTIVVGTNYIQTTYNSIAVGTNNNVTFGKLSFFSPLTVAFSPNYIKYHTAFIEPRYNSIAFGTDTSFTFGKLIFVSPSTLSIGGNSYIDQNLATTSIPQFKALNLGQVNNPCTVSIVSGDYTVYNQPSYLTFQCGYGDNGSDYYTFLKATNNGSGGTSQQELSIGRQAKAGSESIDMKINYAGQITKPKQSMFCAYLTTAANNVTGDGTNWTVAFDATKTNINGNFNIGNGIYTTPVAGVYTFSTTIKLGGIGSGHTDSWCEFNFGGDSMRFSEINPYACQSTGNYLCINGSTGPVYLNASTNVYVVVHVYGSTKTVDVVTDGGTYLTCFFTGTLLG